MNHKQINNPKKLTAKDRARVKIMEFVANSENGFLPWNRLGTEACNYKNSRYIYTIFTPQERREIDQTALTERRKNYSRQTAAVDYGLLKKAMSGDVAAAKLWYQRFEGWSEKQQCEFLDENGVPQKISQQIYNKISMNMMTWDERARATTERMIAEFCSDKEE